ncbi:Man1-Src1p-C-terminal domain-containing protein [Cokeromyces recurvatus]|uniref:Man1-Src1p-C-terminal domain-containing protein n=1 Tax=Cokeromyces recurvatus TaxID=90255 RepID=UPI00221FEEB8|nr:Man1-Src1p-C-terminal domain-containing protein [Cokeromyces recurvatus]KAI7904462.1 Man1-Src1p-C-terminal domain-containing protein [Cokeromyces recurvatus]
MDNHNNSNIPNDLYYLDENFSIRSLRKYQLKQILTSHNIPYLQNITKSDLVNLFKKHIISRREEILKEYRSKQANKQPVEYGLGHRVSHKPTKFYNDDFVESSTIKRRRQQKPNHEKGKTTKASSPTITKYELPLIKDEDGFAIPAPPKRSSNTKLSFNPEDSFGEEDENTNATTLTHYNKVYKKSANGNKESVYSINKTTSIVPDSLSYEDSAFSIPGSNVNHNNNKTGGHFNPEDSFASSADEESHDLANRVRIQKKTSKDLPRKVSFADEVEVEENESDENEEKEIDEEEDDEDYHADEDDSDDDEEDYIGEIDEDELVSLYKDQTIPADKLAKSTEYPVVTRSKTLSAVKRKAMLWKARLKKIGYIFFSTFLFFILIGYFITAYARQKNGYCTSSPTRLPNNTTSLFSFLPSPCIPCPDHGVCIDGELTCDVMYQRKTPFYNIGHLLPIADDCLHNSVLGRHVAIVERKIKNLLALHQGEMTCDYAVNNFTVDDTETIMARIPVKDILTKIKAKMEQKIKSDKFEEILVLALAAALEDPKIHYWESNNEAYLGTEYTKYTTVCKIKRMYKKISFKTKMYIILFISTLSALVHTLSEYRKNKAYKHKMNELVKTILGELQKQYENYHRDPATYDNPALPVSQLRSSILDVNKRETIKDWQYVEEQFKTHPHVRRSFHEIRGDPVEFWEFTT